MQDKLLELKFEASQTQRQYVNKQKLSKNYEH